MRMSLITAPYQAEPGIAITYGNKILIGINDWTFRLHYGLIYILKKQTEIIMKFNSWLEAIVITLGAIATGLCLFAFTAIFFAFVG